MAQVNGLTSKNGSKQWSLLAQGFVPVHILRRHVRHTPQNTHTTWHLTNWQGDMLEFFVIVTSRGKTIAQASIVDPSKCSNCIT